MTEGKRTIIPLGGLEGVHLTIDHNFEFNDPSKSPEFHLGAKNIYGETDHFNLKDNQPGWPNCPNDLYPSLKRAPINNSPY
jgi:hypothetical protein